MAVNIIVRLMTALIVVSGALVGVMRGLGAALPDSGQLAAENFHPLRRVSEIDLLDIGHGIIHTLDAHSGVSARHPVWSPDGSKIAFLSATPRGLRLYVMN